MKNTPKRRAFPEKESPQTLGEVETIKVNPEVWETALQLADGDHHRLKVESSTCVLVLNNPWRKK